MLWAVAAVVLLAGCLNQGADSVPDEGGVDRHTVPVDWTVEIRPSLHVSVAGVGVGVNPFAGSGAWLEIANPDRILGAAFNMTWDAGTPQAETLMLSLLKGAGDQWRLVAEASGTSPLALSVPELNTTRGLALWPQFVPMGQWPIEAGAWVGQEVRIQGMVGVQAPASA